MPFLFKLACGAIWGTFAFPQFKIYMILVMHVLLTSTAKSGWDLQYARKATLHVRLSNYEHLLFSVHYSVCCRQEQEYSLSEAHNAITQDSIEVWYFLPLIYDKG